MQKGHGNLRVILRLGITSVNACMKVESGSLHALDNARLYIAVVFPRSLILSGCGLQLIKRGRAPQRSVTKEGPGTFSEPYLDDRDTFHRIVCRVMSVRN